MGTTVLTIHFLTYSPTGNLHFSVSREEYFICNFPTDSTAHTTAFNYQV